MNPRTRRLRRHRRAARRAPVCPYVSASAIYHRICEDVSASLSRSVIGRALIGAGVVEPPPMVSAMSLAEVSVQRSLELLILGRAP